MDPPRKHNQSDKRRAIAKPCDKNSAGRELRRTSVKLNNSRTSRRSTYVRVGWGSMRIVEKRSQSMERGESEVVKGARSQKQVKKACKAAKRESTN